MEKRDKWSAISETLGQHSNGLPAYSEFAHRYFSQPVGTALWAAADQ
jgi:hypothetical protein